MKRKHLIINPRNAALLALALGTGSVLAVDGVWVTNASGGNWDDASKWVGGVPGGVGSTADFQVSRTSGNIAVTLNGDRTIGILKLGFFGDGRGLDLNAGSNLILDNGGSNAVINFRDGGGNVNIKAATQLNSNLLINNLDNGGNKGFFFTGGISSTNGHLTITNTSDAASRTKFNSVVSDGAAGNSISYNQTAGWSEFTSANTFSGTTTNGGGLLHINIGTALQNSALNTTGSVTGSGTQGLRIVGAGVTTLTLGGLTGNKNIDDDGTGVFSSTSGNYTQITALTLNPGTGKSHSYDGAITDGAVGMTLTKTGDGIQTLGGTSTYTGDTLVSAGTLFVNGSLSAATNDVTVATTGAIGGDGSIAGSLAFASGADFVFSTTMTLDVAGAVTFGSFGIADLVGLDSSVAVGTYTLINGGTVDFTNVINVGLANAVSLGGGKSAYLQSGSLQVVVTAIPEPGTALLGGLGILALLRRRRG
jgi:fibronectin-binding autotransporter adhesin